MTDYNPKHWLRQLFFGIAAILIVTIVLSLCGCSSSKKTTSDSAKKEVVIKRDSVFITKSDTVFVKTTETKKETDADVIFDTGCDTVWVDTGSVRTINKIKWLPGGGFEASGNIKSFKLKENELAKQVTEWKAKHETSVKVSDSLSALVSELKKTSTKKTTWFPWWLLLVAYALGCLLPPNKIISLIKNKRS